ncbi:hypothetical protein GCM10023214_15500 [Amycolatopsis dongchuanensis]|uniref:Alpha/beta fold hydrolase n=2 Tax=Pseudonocardiaceae TaxID=2070 RepID=A0ABP9Q542_9PSEU
MGVSGGGTTALQLALDHPAVVRRLVVCVAASRIDGSGMRDLRRVMALESQGRSPARVATRLVAHGPVRLPALAGFALAPKRARAPGEAALVEAAAQWDVTGRLGEITAPTLDSA